MNRAEAKELIGRFVAGETTDWEWDDFVSTPSRDSLLESLRVKCLQVRDEFPPERAGEYCSESGAKQLLALADDLPISN